MLLEHVERAYVDAAWGRTELNLARNWTNDGPAFGETQAFLQEKERLGNRATYDYGTATDASRGENILVWTTFPDETGR